MIVLHHLLLPFNDLANFSIPQYLGTNVALPPARSDLRHSRLIFVVPGTMSPGTLATHESVIHSGFCSCHRHQPPATVSNETAVAAYLNAKGGTM